MIYCILYSGECKECMNLWQVIFSENLIKKFLPICLDKMSSATLITLSIKVVPTIVISGTNMPSSILHGPKECSLWLNSFIYNERKNAPSRVEDHLRLVQRTQAIARIQDGGPIEYTENEMDGISDNYSYTGIDICQPKSFAMIGQESNYSIITPIIKENKIDDDTLLKKLKEIETSRDGETKEMMAQMEKKQIESVINYNM